MSQALMKLLDLPELRELPRWIDQLNQGCDNREILFRNIAVPVVEQQSIQQRLPDVHVQLDLGIASGNIAADLKNEIQRWLDLSDAGHALEAGELLMTLPVSVDLTEFLRRLAQTREYELQPSGLAQRVCTLLHNLAAYKIPREEAVAAIHDALSSCNDGIIICLRHLKLRALVEQAYKCPMPEVRLRNLGEDLVKLEVIQECMFEIARKQEALGTMPDQVEILLYLETQLAPKMALPLENRHMLFATRAGVSAADVDRTQARANQAAANQSRVNRFLAQWQPWQVYQRRLALAAFDKAGQSMLAMPQELQEAQCPFTVETGKVLRLRTYSS